MTLYPNLDDVLDIHDDSIVAFGGRHGVRDRALLQSAIERAKASYGGVDLYPSNITKAAALFESLIRNHPFVDGNKRTACAVLFAFLHVNGQPLTVSDEELEDFALHVAGGKRSFEDIVDWIAAHT